MIDRRHLFAIAAASTGLGRPAAHLRRLPGPVSIVPLERWTAGDGPEQGELERYRVNSPGGVRDLVAGWTPDDRLYWVV